MRLGEAADHGDGRLELVGGGGQEQRLGLVGLLQPGDVTQGVDDLHAALLVGDGEGARQQGLAPAVGHLPPHLPAPTRLAGGAVLEERTADAAVEGALAVVQAQGADARHADDEGPLGAHQPLAGRIGLQDDAVAVGDHDPVGHAGQDGLGLLPEVMRRHRGHPVVAGDPSHDEGQAHHGEGEDDEQAGGLAVVGGNDALGGHGQGDGGPQEEPRSAAPPQPGGHADGQGAGEEEDAPGPGGQALGGEQDRHVAHGTAVEGEPEEPAPAGVGHAGQDEQDGPRQPEQPGQQEHGADGPLPPAGAHQPDAGGEPGDSHANQRRRPHGDDVGVADTGACRPAHGEESSGMANHRPATAMRLRPSDFAL